MGFITTTTNRNSGIPIGAVSSDTGRAIHYGGHYNGHSLNFDILFVPAFTPAMASVQITDQTVYGTCFGPYLASGAIYLLH